MKTNEQIRLEVARNEKIPWKKWEPYLSERQWGTVREDYSDRGDAWNYFPPRSRVFARLLLGRGWPVLLGEIVTTFVMASPSPSSTISIVTATGFSEG